MANNYTSSHTGSQIDLCVDTYQNAQQVQAAINAAKLAMFPVGSIYISTNGTNPSTFIGGTWVAFATGRTIIGIGTGTDSTGLDRTFTSGEADGEYEHTLTIDEMPSHQHQHTNISNHDTDSSASQGYPYGNHHNSPRTTDRTGSWVGAATNYQGGAAATTIYLPILQFICGNERRKSPQGGER